MTRICDVIPGENVPPDNPLAISSYPFDSTEGHPITLLTWDEDKSQIRTQVKIPCNKIRGIITCMHC